MLSPMLDAATVQIGPMMQVTRLENKMARAIFELDWFGYAIQPGNNVRLALERIVIMELR